MGSQVNSGKAFEYSLFISFIQLFKNNSIAFETIEDKAFLKAKEAYLGFSDIERASYDNASLKAIRFLPNIEPWLLNPNSQKDKIKLRIASDREGQKGDVRDVIVVRDEVNWEIGISAKNRHRAVKHSRLSQTIDFGKDWLGLKCSNEYFLEIEPIFSHLSRIRKSVPSTTWNSLGDTKEKYYQLVLIAFKEELIRLNESHSGVVPKMLIKYLIGNEDFYKVIREERKVEIQAFNLDGKLNQSAKSIRPKDRIPKIKYPSRIIDLGFKKEKSNTLILILDEGWQFSFRIHSASSKVESSFKLDINLISTPSTLFTQHLFV